MPKFKNTCDSFGEPGPFEAESKEALADEMAPTLKTWVNEAEASWSQEYNTPFDREGWLHNTRLAFIRALEEVAE